MPPSKRLAGTECQMLCGCLAFPAPAFTEYVLATVTGKPAHGMAPEGSIWKHP